MVWYLSDILGEYRQIFEERTVNKIGKIMKNLENMYKQNFREI